MAIDYFVPGIPSPAAGLLNGLLPVWPGGVARHFVEMITHPDAIVLDPFAVSEVPIREAAAAGRRVIASNHNPLVVILLRQRLSPPEAEMLKATLTRLGDTLKRGVPLREHLNRLYRTRCPTCRQPAVADYFIWSREPADPRQKWVACSACGQAGLAAVDEDDLAILDEVETRGLHYWYLLDRVASPARPPASAEARARAEALMELYTPRALYAIADLLMRIEATFDEETQTHLKGALLTCLAAASSLFPPGLASPPTSTSAGRRSYPATLDKLQPPERFIEYNLWRLFERAIQRVTASSAYGPPLPLQPDLHWVTRLPSSPQGLVWVHNLGVGAIGRGLSPESVALVLTTPPRPDPVFWSLAYLWTGWLLGPEAAARLKDLALQKWPDWSWYHSTLATALRALRPVLRFDGVCVLILQDAPPQQAFAVVLAATAAGYNIESWQHRTTGEHQYSLTPAPLHTSPAQEPEALRARVVSESARAALKFVHARGEPVQTETLHIAAWHRLVRKGIIATAQASLPTGRVLSWLNSAINQGLEEAQRNDLIPVSGDAERPLGWWLSKVDGEIDDPLSDRVEDAVLAGLRDAPEDELLSEIRFVQSLYQRFNGPLTPDAGLVRACLQAYGEEPAPARWRLHPGEREDVWQEKLKSGRRDLLALGERLGYQVHEQEKGSGVVWEEEGHPWAIFELVLTAHGARFLPHVDTTPAAQEVRWRNLVIPAARTVLWQHKLETYPWLAQMIKAGGWTFIKLEHLQSLAVREALTRHDLKTIAGLSPPLERGEGQLPLF
ncbi:MAG: hypothetical protein Kow0063_21600 [Anaerolineae bacterium]